MILTKETLDKVFLTAKNPYSQKKQLNIKNISIAFIIIILSFLILGGLLEKKKIETLKTSNYLNDLPRKKSSSLSGSYIEPEYDDIELPQTSKENSNKSKKIFNREALIGSKSAVKLLGRVIAKSHKQVPIRAKIIPYKTSQDGYELDFKLKTGSVLLGKGRLDPLTERLHITFHSLLMEGKKFSIQAKAFMENGTFGIKGKFNSGELKKYGARFGSNFVGGVSQGLKQKTMTSSGAVFESGGLKNAILNGLSLSFLDYAQDKARKHEAPTAEIILKEKTLFFVYFE